MRRIGLAASKMARGNFWQYNIFVVLLSTLCAVFLLVICGFALVLALFLMSLVLRWFIPSKFPGEWWELVKICMGMLVVLIAGLNILAIAKNVRFKKPEL